jgi:hypothetical protein
MKKLVMLLIALGFITMSSNAVFAEWFSKGQPEKAAAAAPAPQAAPQVVSKKQMGKIQDMIAKKKLEINGTQWAIDTKPMSGKGKAEKDVLSFLDGKVSSKNMEARGYIATNYSMRLLEDNETYTWETMQVSEKEGTAFWRGDIGSDGVMRGVVSVRNKKNVVSDYNFVSAESKKVSVASVEATPVVPAAPAAPIVPVEEKK